MRLKFAVLVLFIAAAGCSGGVSRVTPAASVPQPTASAAAATANATFTITIPPRTPSHAARLPKFVPSQVNSIRIQVNGTSSITTNVTPGSSTYSQSLGVPVGTNTFTVLLFDGANGGGNLLGAGTQTALITQAGPNNVPVTINGRVAFISYSVVPTSQTQITITPIGIDAQGNTISGTYLSPIALNDPDVSGHTTLNGAGTTAQIAASGQSATLNWDTLGATGCSAVMVNASTPGTSTNILIPLGNKVVTNLNNAGAGSLANAISTASAGDIIVFAVTGSIPWPASVTINQSISICGPPGPAPSITIQGGGANPLLNMASALTATISNIKFAGGVNSGGGGGAINDIGPCTLNLNFDVFQGNSATGSSNAGAIYENAGNTLNISNSTFISNSTTGTGNGGALVIGGNATINSSLLTGNSTAQGGGAIYMAGGTLTINSSTIYSNGAGGPGGGIAVPSGGSSLTVNASTIYSNSAAGGASGIDFPAAGTVNISGSLIFGGNNADFSNNAYTVNNSLVSNTNSATILGNVNNILNGATPVLGPLANNGGPTQTLKLISGPGIGAIPSGSCSPPIDQRGVPRPVSGSFCDMGAFEKT